MHTDDELIECKTVLKGNKQITIKLTDLRKLKYTAATQGKKPILHIEIDNEVWVLEQEIDYLEGK